jgi:hypothetical protein
MLGDTGVPVTPRNSKIGLLEVAFHDSNKNASMNSRGKAPTKGSIEAGNK